MRVLLDTNILIHREARTVDRDDIGTLFRWLDQIGAQKCVHPASLEEIARNPDPAVVHGMKAKIASYHILKTIAKETPAFAALRAKDRNENDKTDTSLLLELAAGRVEALITEDRGIHRKARDAGLSASVFTIDSFLEKVTAENPALSEYRVLSVKREYFGNVNLADPFFDSFRTDYPGFDRWFNKKSDESAYVCFDEGGNVLAFLYLKREGRDENYSNISPTFAPANRLKIGTLKVASNGYKLGERFLKIAFDNALQFGVDEIYVTAFGVSPEQYRLVKLLEDWGFNRHGTKTSAAGTEQVFVRDFRPRVEAADPRKTYPYITRKARHFIVPIYPEYHTELLPDSILNTESPENFVENRPNRNAISKVYVSRSIERSLQPGDVIIFYRTGSGNGPAHYTSVATTLGVVQEVITGIPDKATFLKICRKRSVFTDAELQKHWDYNPKNRPFVVNFLYLYSLPRRPTLSALKSEGIITGAPRGFDRISPQAFQRLLEISNANQRLVLD